jgi:hypothetical protein
MIKERTTAEVLQHHMDFLAMGNVEETVADYAQDAVIITGDGMVKGKDAIRAFFTNSVTNVLPPDTTNTLLKKEIEGELALIIWSAESRFFSIPFGTDTFVIRDGQIHLQTFAGILKKK